MQSMLASNCLCSQGCLGLVFLHLLCMSCLWGLNLGLCARQSSTLPTWLQLQPGQALSDLGTDAQGWLGVFLC